MHIALWVIAVLLAGAFLVAGFSKVMSTRAALAEKGLTYVEDFSDGSIKAIGWAEILGARPNAAPFETARWVSSEDPADLKTFADLNRTAMAKDRDGNPVFLAKSAWEVGYIADRYPNVRFAATRER